MAQTKKKLEDILFPSDVQYFREHTWARVEGELVRIGISDYAQDQLGDIIFLELPEAGSVYERGQEFGCAESAKSVSALFMPISGQIEEVNQELIDFPEIVNQDSYGAGWMIIVKPQDVGQLVELLTKDGYIRLLE